MALKLASGRAVLIDCGEATQHQCMRSRSVSLQKIDVVLLTHLHGDHCFGIFGLICTMAMGGRETPLRIVAPEGARRMVEVVLTTQAGGTPFEPFPIVWDELKADENADLSLESVGLTVAARPLEHRVPAFGYVLREADREGALDAAKAMAAGARGPQLGALKRGKDVRLDDGTVVRAADCTGATVPGRTLAVLQDTSNSDRALEAARGCDLLVHECTLHDAMRELAIERGHSTGRMAGEYAVRCGAKMLVLTHMSPRYKYRVDAAPDVDVCVEDLVAEAIDGCEGRLPVVAARDFTALVAKRGGFEEEPELDFNECAEE